MSSMKSSVLPCLQGGIDASAYRAMAKGILCGSKVGSFSLEMCGENNFFRPNPGMSIDRFLSQ